MRAATLTQILVWGTDSALGSCFFYFTYFRHVLVQVTGVVEGSPFVGLVRAGAQIIAVDDIDCCGKGLDVVVQILRSTAGKPRVIRLSQRRLPAKPAALPAMPPV